MGNENSISSDLIRGHIDTIILRSLYDSDKHGNEICLDIEDKSGGQYEIKQPTLYSALKRLETTGLVNAYWASGVGGRRRYFKLTDEGKKVCEDNLNLWIHSRNVIDKLISDGSDLGYPVYEAIESPVQHVYIPPVDPVQTQPKFDPSEYENYSFASAIPSVSDDDFIEPDDEVVGIAPPINDNSSLLKTVDDTDPETKIQAEENEENLNNINNDSAVTQLSLIEEPDVEPEEEALPTPEEEAVESIIETKAELPPLPSEPLEEIPDGEDDTLVLEPYASVTKEYSDILKRLYPKFDEDEIVDEPAVTEEVLLPQAEQHEEKPETVIPLPDENFEVKNKTVTVTTDDVVAEKKPVEKEKNSGDIDYTDIISLAHMQGFRVKTSDKTNRTRKGKLFITKLCAASAAILFAVIAVEMAALCIPLNDILGFIWSDYCIMAAVFVIFPLACLIALMFARNRTVDKLPTLKYCVTASIVVVLNLILLTFALVLALQIDLYNARNIILYLIIPIVTYLNIPLYYFIKYLMVSKNRFFTSD